MDRHPDADAGHRRVRRHPTGDTLEPALARPARTRPARVRRLESEVARAAARADHVHRELHRPRERRLRRSPPRGVDRHRRGRIRPRRRAVLRRLRAVRGAVEPADAALRRAHLAGPDHGDVGHRRGRDGVRVERHVVLRAALPARRGRGRLLPGRRAVPVAMVAAAGARQGDGDLPRRFRVRVGAVRPSPARCCRSAASASKAGNGCS